VNETEKNVYFRNNIAGEGPGRIQETGGLPDQASKGDAMLVESRDILEGQRNAKERRIKTKDVNVVDRDLVAMKGKEFVAIEGYNDVSEGLAKEKFKDLNASGDKGFRKLNEYEVG
jgi:hypothetical protein